MREVERQRKRVEGEKGSFESGSLGIDLGIRGILKKDKFGVVLLGR